jgi:hypothetical protein
MMKKLLVIAALALLPTLADASEPVYASPPHAMNDGDGAPTNYMRQVIFRNRPCTLGLADDANMREFQWAPVPNGMVLKGCAAKLLNDRFLVIYSYGGQFVQDIMPMALYKYGTLDDGIITVGAKLR